MQPCSEVLRQHLTQRHTSAQAHRIARNAATSTAALGKLGDRLRGLVLHKGGHILTNHAHADFLIEDFLQLFGQRDVLYRHAFELQADFFKLGCELLDQCLGKHQLVGRQIQKGHAAAGNRIADVLQHQAAQLAIYIGHRVSVACAGDFGVEQLGIGNAEVEVAKGAHAHRAKVCIADGDGLGRAPLLVDLLARAEEVHIALERRLKQLVPVFQVGQHRQGLRGELVGTRAKHVGHFAFVDEHRHLRLANDQLATVLDFHARHREAPGERAVALFGPLNNVNKLFLDEVHQSHGVLLSVRVGVRMILAVHDIVSTGLFVRMANLLLRRTRAFAPRTGTC